VSRVVVPRCGVFSQKNITPTAGASASAFSGPSGSPIATTIPAVVAPKLRQASPRLRRRLPPERASALEGLEVVGPRDRHLPAASSEVSGAGRRHQGEDEAVAHCLVARLEEEGGTPETGRPTWRYPCQRPEILLGSRLVQERRARTIPTTSAGRASECRQAPDIPSVDDPADEGVEVAWLAEVERRLQGVDRGTAKFDPWEVVRTRIAARLRANQTSMSS